MSDPLIPRDHPHPDAQFVTPVELNAIDPIRLVIGGMNTVFESFDQGSTITVINGPRANVMRCLWRQVRWGRQPGCPLCRLRYSEPPGVLRTIAGAPLAPTAALPAGADPVRDVVIDPDDWRSAYVVDSNQVFRTTNAGASWTDITGNLRNSGP